MSHNTDSIKAINDILTLYLALPNSDQDLVKKIIINSTKTAPLTPIPRSHSEIDPNDGCWRKSLGISPLIGNSGILTRGNIP